MIKWLKSLFGFEAPLEPTLQADKDTVETKTVAKPKKTKKAATKKPAKVELKIGDTVKLEDGKASGQIENIEKGIASVNYGLFVTKVQIDQLIFVKRDK